jgi:phosphate uptake regulator
MKRKVNRVGQNTLTVSLPNKWAKKQGIKVGDEIEVKEDGNIISITTQGQKSYGRKVILNVDVFNKHMINRHFHEFYRQGIDEISIHFSKFKLHDHKRSTDIEIEKYINKLVGRFIGMEIVSQTKDKIVIQSLIKDDYPEKIETTKNRIYFLIKEYLNEFINSMEYNFNEFYEKSYDYHDNISKFTYYYLRLLHFSDISEDKKQRLCSLYIILDKTIDKIRHTAERVFECGKVSKKTKSYLIEIFDLFLEQFDMISKPNYTLQQIDRLINRRYALVHKLNKDKLAIDEQKIISECKILLDTINDFSETYIALNIEKYIS